MSQVDFAETDESHGPKAFAVVAALAGFTLYVAAGAFATLVAPAAFVIFLAPLAVMIAVKAPASRAAPARVVRMLIFAAAALAPLWPVYIHLKVGPLPILTPPRLLLYFVTAIWLHDMTVSPFRRAQFVLALRKGAAITGPVIFLFALGALSVPFAEGKAIALQEFLRQTTIWLAPFLAILTYMRRTRDLERILILLTCGAALSAAIALAETASGTLLASLLAPFIGDDGQWLQAAQAQKIRDGVFRAQASHTHPLSLGEFMAFTAPLAFAFLVAARRNARRVGWAACLALIVAGALATNSRGAILAIAVGLGLSVAAFAVGFLRKAGAARFRPAAGLAVILILAASPLIATVGHHVIAGVGGEQAARSSQSRVDQIEQATPKILKRPLLGHGTGRAARVLGYWGTTLTLDNYYLTLALDLGFPGPIAFFGVLIAAGAVALRRAATAPPGMGAVYIGLACALGCFALTRSIVSMTGNLSTLYVVLAAMAGLAAASPRIRI